jgi:hypothetical protein
MLKSATFAQRRAQSLLLRAGMALDLALYVDTALRWEIGVTFLRVAWLQTALIFTLTSWLVRRFFARFLVVDFVQAILIFPLWCWAFYLASSGNPYFNWRTLPVADFFRVSLLDSWLFDGGFLTAGIAAVASAALAPGWRHSTPQGKPRSAASWLRGLGLSMVIVAGVAFMPTVSLPSTAYVAGRDPRDPTGDKEKWLQRARVVAWSLIALAGVWQLRRGFAAAREERTDAAARELKERTLEKMTGG